MSLKNFTLEIDTDGIALVTFDSPGKSMNVISAGGSMSHATLIERV